MTDKAQTTLPVCKYCGSNGIGPTRRKPWFSVKSHEWRCAIKVKKEVPCLNK